MKSPFAVFDECRTKWLAGKWDANTLYVNSRAYAVLTALAMFLVSVTLIPFLWLVSQHPSRGLHILFAIWIGLVVGGGTGLSLSFFVVFTPAAAIARRAERGRKRLSPPSGKSAAIFVHSRAVMIAFVILGICIVTPFFIPW